MSGLQPFSMPRDGSVLPVSVTTTASVASAVDGGGAQVMVMNAGTQGCYFAMGDDTVEATNNDVWMPGNYVRVFSVGASQTHISAITPTGTTTLLAVLGNGA